MNIQGINVIGYFQGRLGLGETARLIVSSLEKQRVPFSLISADFVAPHHSKMTSSYKCEEECKYPINLFCLGLEDVPFFIQSKGHKYAKGRYNIGLFFWETNVIPHSIIKKISHFDEIWVMSRYNQECLSAVTTVPVHHIPHPIRFQEPEIFNKASYGLPDKYTFLFCFDFYGIVQRKNPIATVKAFQKAFSGCNDVQLVIKSLNGDRHKQLLQPLLNEISGDSRIRWIDEAMSAERRYGLINACDCYVSLHRSEGFGLSLAEAMAMGKPVIATGYSGNLDFMTQKNSYLCDFALVPIGPNIRPYPPNGLWADVNIDQAASWMNHVVNDRPEATIRGLLGQKEIRSNNSLDAVGICIEERLQKIVPHSKKSYGQWYFNSICSIAQYYCKGMMRRARSLYGPS